MRRARRGFLGAVGVMATMGVMIATAAGDPPVAAPGVPVARQAEAVIRPRFSAPIAVPGGSARAASVPVAGGIAVPASARAGAEDRAREEAARAAREAEAAALGAREGDRGARETIIESATVMRAGDKRYGITVFRNLFPVRRWSPRPAECVPTPAADQARPIVPSGASGRNGERADAAPAKPARPLGGERRPRPAPTGPR